MFHLGVNKSNPAKTAGFSFQIYQNLKGVARKIVDIVCFVYYIYSNWVSTLTTGGLDE